MDVATWAQNVSLPPQIVFSFVIGVILWGFWFLCTITPYLIKYFKERKSIKARSTKGIRRTGNTKFIIGIIILVIVLIIIKIKG